MKGGVTQSILELLKDSALGTGDLIAAVLSAGYGASSGKLEYAVAEQRRARAKAELKRQTQQRYYNLIYKLKRDGIVAKKHSRNKILLTLTAAGKEKLAVLEKRAQSAIQRPVYKTDSDSKIRVVIFDIPETDKKKREWLRAVLRQLGFKMIQKSVWFGKTKLPVDFLSDLSRLRMIDYVEIFEISKTGSLTRID